MQGVLQSLAFVAIGLLTWKSLPGFAAGVMLVALLLIVAGVYLDRVRTKVGAMAAPNSTIGSRALVAVWVLAMTVAIASYIVGGTAPPLVWLIGIALAFTTDRVVVPAWDYLSYWRTNYARRHWARLDIQARDAGFAEARRDDDGSVVSVIVPKDLPLGPIYAPLERDFAVTYRDEGAARIREFETCDERRKRVAVQNASLLATVLGFAWIPTAMMGVGILFVALMDMRD